MQKAHRLFERLTIVTDTREQNAYEFRHPTVRGTLETGDYSIRGFEDRVAIERKSLDDLVGCLKDSQRERFERELRRSRAMDFFGVVLEASLSDLAGGAYRSGMLPASVVQSILALSVRYRVPIYFAENRTWGQRVTESLLEKFARDVCRRFADLAAGIDVDPGRVAAVAGKIP